jgi:hypothetical protein
MTTLTAITKLFAGFLLAVKIHRRLAMFLLFGTHGAWGRQA